MQKTTKVLIPTHYRQMNAEWTLDLTKYTTIKLLEENTGGNLFVLYKAKSD